MRFLANRCVTAQGIVEPYCTQLVFIYIWTQYFCLKPQDEYKKLYWIRPIQSQNYCRKLRYYVMVLFLGGSPNCSSKVHLWQKGNCCICTLHGLNSSARAHHLIPQCHHIPPQWSWGILMFVMLCVFTLLFMHGFHTRGQWTNTSRDIT